MLPAEIRKSFSEPSTTFSQLIFSCNPPTPPLCYITAVLHSSWTYLLFTHTRLSFLWCLSLSCFLCPTHTFSISFTFSLKWHLLHKETSVFFQWLCFFLPSLNLPFPLGPHFRSQCFWSCPRPFHITEASQNHWPMARTALGPMRHTQVLGGVYLNVTQLLRSTYFRWVSSQGDCPLNQ